MTRTHTTTTRTTERILFESSVEAAEFLRDLIQQSVVSEHDLIKVNVAIEILDRTGFIPFSRED